MSLKFGKETYTLAMIAGIAKRKITWKDILEGKTMGIIYVLILLTPLPEENGLKLAA